MTMISSNTRMPSADPATAQRSGGESASNGSAAGVFSAMVSVLITDLAATGGTAGGDAPAVPAGEGTTPDDAELEDGHDGSQDGAIVSTLAEAVLAAVAWPAARPAPVPLTEAAPITGAAQLVTGLLTGAEAAIGADVDPVLEGAVPPTGVEPGVEGAPPQTGVEPRVDGAPTPASTRPGGFASAVVPSPASTAIAELGDAGDEGATGIVGPAPTGADMPPAAHSDSTTTLEAAAALVVGAPPEPQGGENVAVGGPVNLQHVVATEQAPPAVGEPAPPSAQPVAATLPDQLVKVIAPYRRGPDGTHQVTIQLRPDELGEVQVDVRVVGNEVSLTLRADLSATADLLRTGLAELRAELEAAGFRSASLDVGDRGRSDQHQRFRSDPDGTASAASGPQPAGDRSMTAVTVTASGGLDLRL